MQIKKCIKIRKAQNCTLKSYSLEVIFLDLKNKKEVRRAILEHRDNIGANIKEEWDKKIFSKLMNSEDYKNADVIFVFVSFRSEVDTHRIIVQALKDSKTICVPKINVKEKEMEIFKIENLEELKLGYYGILEPREDCQKVDCNYIDLILMPGAAFDNQGGRVGYGGGFYDRFLKRMNKKVKRIALAYEFQVLDKVPVEEFDVRIDGIITNEKYVEIHK